MFSLQKHLFICVIIYITHLESCSSVPPSLVLYSPGEAEFTEVLVRKVHDNLTLVCELRNAAPRTYVWNYVGNGTHADRALPASPAGPSSSSKLLKWDLQLHDSGHYMCSAPPFSVSKYILVQSKGPIQCARSAFWCGARCVLVSYICDGRTDCLYGEDEDVNMCGHDICSRQDKLNCSAGRCISSSACCNSDSVLCRQPACCNEHSRMQAADGYIEAEYPPLYEDRRAPDDYGFIQSTIYTVTACALIFMIAVVLLVSAICKMQMKRAALRSYSQQHIQSQRYPPCYEASRLLERDDTPAAMLSLSNTQSPSRGAPCEGEGRGLSRLSHIFSSRYRQVPTRPPDVELIPLPPRLESPVEMIEDYTRCNNNDANCSRDRLTLQLGRFQLSVPRVGRPRPPTPTVTHVELLRLPDTYTLNGRTIRLLGAELECPDTGTMDAGSEGPHVGSQGPPTYMEAVRYKIYGPPPEYLSRDGLNRRSVDHVDEDATNNVELPPCYYELANNNDNIINNGENNVVINESIVNNGVNNDNIIINNGNTRENNDNIVNNVNITYNDDTRLNNDNCTNNATCIQTNVVNSENNTPSCNDNVIDTRDINNYSFNGNNSTIETLSSIIDNLPAIDSDVNANDANYDNIVVNNDNFVINSDNSVNTSDNLVNNDNVVISDVTNSMLNNSAIIAVNNVMNNNE